MPSLLDTGLPFMRAITGALLPDSAIVSRPVFVDDGQGGKAQGTPLSLGPYPVRLEARRRTPIEQPEAGRVVSVMEWTAYLPHGTDVKATDQLTITSSAFYPGRTFEVLGDNDARSSSVVMAVNLKEVR